MAVAHIAFSLDLDAFNQLLAGRVVIDGKRRPDLLYVLAVERLANRTEDMDYALDSLRFSEEWLDTQEGDEYEWFWIVLASVVAPVESMSDRVVFGHFFIRQLLTKIDDWTPAEISYLFTGNTDYGAYLIPQFKNMVGNYTGPPIPNSLGMGWLNQQDAQQLSDKLKSTKQRVSVYETESIVTHYSQFNDKKFTMSHELILEIMDDAIQMLETAIKRVHSLFLILSD